MINFNGTPCVELTAGRYTSLIAYEIGCNVIRLRDTENCVEFFRFDDQNPAETIINSPEVWGMPTLYFPNRLADGILKTSDAVYHWPVNEKNRYNNHIHGFIHKRIHNVVEYSFNEEKAWLKTRYDFDENDEFYQYFPVKFTVEYTFTLSDEGLFYEFTMTNTSNKQLPYGVCNHTAMNGPFTKDGEGLDMRLYVPVGDKWELSKSCIPTGGFLRMTDHDKQYLTGSQIPVLHDIDNDVFFAEEGTLDGKPFYGAVATDVKTKKRICYEVSRDFKFWVIWNDHGDKGYFCPEPCTWIIDAPNQPLPADESGYKELKPGERKTISQKIYTM